MKTKLIRRNKKKPKPVAIMTNRERQYFATHISGDYLEFGTGGSTLIASERCDLVYTIDSDVK